MTPVEKAQELYLKYYGIPLYVKTVKECCNIAVDEIIKAIPVPIIKTFDRLNFVEYEDSINYWSQVKEEINKL